MRLRRARPLNMFLFTRFLFTNEAVALSYASLLRFHEEAPEEDFIGGGGGR